MAALGRIQVLSFMETPAIATDEGIAALVDFIGRNSTLGALDLSRTGMHDAASKRIADAVASAPESSVLRTVRLSYNNGSTNGAKREFSSAGVLCWSQSWNRLSHLAFHGCGVGWKKGTLVGRSHQSNNDWLEETLTGLQGLDIDGNLRTLNLGGNMGSCKASYHARMLALREALEQKRQGWRWVRYALMGHWRREDGTFLNPDCVFSTLSWHVMIRILQSLEHFSIHL